VQQCRVLPQEASLVLGQVGQPIDVFLDALRLRLLLRRVLPIAPHRLGTSLGLYSALPASPPRPEASAQPAQQAGLPRPPRA
jgi:hypothetical protein